MGEEKTSWRRAWDGEDRAWQRATDGMRRIHGHDGRYGACGIGPRTETAKRESDNERDGDCSTMTYKLAAGRGGCEEQPQRARGRLGYWQSTSQWSMTRCRSLAVLRRPRSCLRNGEGRSFATLCTRSSKGVQSELAHAPACLEDIVPIVNHDDRSIGILCPEGDCMSSRFPIALPSANVPACLSPARMSQRAAHLALECHLQARPSLSSSSCGLLIVAPTVLKQR